MHPYDNITLESLQNRVNVKWSKYGKDVLPLWVADMDFPTSDVIIESLVSCARENNLVYQNFEGIDGLREAIVTREAERYNWHIQPDDLWLVHGIIPGMFLANMVCASAGDETIMQTPIYPPFMMATQKTNRTIVQNPLIFQNNRWEIDFDRLEEQTTPSTRLFMFCNPHNPTGRVYTREELEKLADYVLRHRLWVLSDELHSDITFEGQQHIPFASLSDEIAQRTITLFGPTKTFNMAGLKMGILATQNAELMQRLKDVGYGMLMTPNTMVQNATLTAFTDPRCAEWLTDTISYIDKNRQLVANFLESELPQIKHTTPEATYLSWMDFSALGLEGEKLEDIFVNECKVGLNMGEPYGDGGAGFARINFATSTAIVQEGLDRLKKGLTPYL